MELRERKDTSDVTILELPVVFKGTATECGQYAVSRGFRWKPHRAWLFGGYYANTDGDCLYVT